MKSNQTRLPIPQFVFSVFICSMLGSFNTRAVPIATAQSTSTSAIDAVLQTSFGTPVEAVGGFKPYYLTGDFNGDGAQDALVVVRVKGRRAELPKDVQLMNPFGFGSKVPFPIDPAKENRLAIAIVHGWRSPRPTAKFLLLGDSPILTLQYDRTTSGRAEDSKDLMSLMTRRGPRPKGQRFPATAKGDVVLLFTEVGGNSMLYWNGRTYRWQDAEGGN
jgi:hypothetical protein